MRQTFNPIRLLAEILIIVALAQAAVMLALSVIAPAFTFQGRVLLGIALLVLLAGPTVYWRSMVVAGQAPRASVPSPEGNRSLAWAIGMTALAQALGLALTAVAVVWQQRAIEADALVKFERGADRIQEEIERRLDRPAYGLMGARGMYAATGLIDRGTFRAYVASRDLPTEFPGVRGFGFIQRVMRKDLARFVDEERANGTSDFAVRSSGDAPDLYVLKYLEPLASNRGSQGLDLGQDPARREAVERAVASGRPVLTGQISLMRDGKPGPGFVYLVPVYRRGAELGNTQQRQAALIGLLSAPIIASEIMSGVADAADGLLDFELFDGSPTDAKRLVFDADPHLKGAQGKLTDTHVAGRSLATSRNFEVGGRKLVLRISTTPAFNATINRSHLAFVALGGALVSFLAALTVWLLAVGRTRAQRRAERMTADLDRLARVVQHTSNAVVIADAQLRITWVNEGFTHISGYTLAEAQGRTPGELLANDKADPAAVRALREAGAAGEACRIEILNRAKDGRDYWIDTEVQPMRDAQGTLTGFMEIGTDITARKQAEQAHLAAEDELRIMLDVFPGYIARASEDFHYEYANERFAALFGLTPEQIKGRHARDVLGEERFEETRQRRDQIVASGQPISFERHVQPPSGGKGLDLLITHFMIEPTSPGGRRRFYQFAIDITDRKRAEVALAARSAELGAVLDAYPGMLARINDDMHYTYVNERFADLLGKPREQIVGHHVREILGAEREAEIQAMLPRVLAGEPIQRERRYPVEGGEDLAIQVSFVGGPDAERPGHSMHYAFGSDVTEMRQQQQRLASIIDGTHAGTFEWNVQTGEMRLNERWAEIVGYTVAELQPVSVETWDRLIHPDDRPRTREILARHLDGGSERFEQELRVRHKDGHWVWVLDRGRLARRTPTGEPQWMLGTRQDITAHKLAEQSLVAQTMFQSMVADIAVDFVAANSANIDDKITATLQRIGEFFDVDRSDLFFFSEDYLTLSGTHEWCRPGIASKMKALKDFRADRAPWYCKRILEDKTFVHFPDVAQLPPEASKEKALFEAMNLKSGLSVPIYTQKRVYGMVGFNVETKYARWSDNDIHGMSVVAQTIATSLERLDADKSLLALKEAAEQASRAKSEFLSSMSHELRTPMNAILGFGQLLDYDATLPDEHRDNVQEILKAGHHLLGLINEVLDLAKVESGQIELSLEPVEADPVVEECLSLVGLLASKRRIRISHKEFKGATVRADRTRLKQALLNLLSNAIKYNREGGSVSVEVRPETAGSLSIRVIDTGPGIPAHRLTELFQPFNRLDAEASQIEGTGIGLTITRRIVEMMGGSVDVQSEVGVGSCFWIELPRDEEASRAQGSGTGASSTTARLDGLQHTLLYIEDNPSNIKLVAQILSRHKHIHLLTAHTPELGLELARTRRPELILLDINMPGMNGYQVLKLLQTDARTKQIPVIAITANAMPADIERGEAAGFASYLTKPINLQQLLSAIDRCLAG